MSNKEYECKNCFNKATFLCQSCATTQHPSGKTSKPTRYVGEEDVLREIDAGEDLFGKILLGALSGGRAKAKPPLGLKPKYIHDAQRTEEIKAAVSRYLSDDKPIPPEWIEEYNTLVKVKKN